MRSVKEIMKSDIRKVKEVLKFTPLLLAEVSLMLLWLPVGMMVAMITDNISATVAAMVATFAVGAYLATVIYRVRDC